MATDLEKWKSRQIAAAIERGVNPLDSARALDDFLANVPPTAEPESYVLPPVALGQNLVSSTAIHDARGAWYADVEPRMARLLDAKEAI